MWPDEIQIIKLCFSDSLFAASLQRACVCVHCSLQCVAAWMSAGLCGIICDV